MPPIKKGRKVQRNNALRARHIHLQKLQEIGRLKQAGVILNTVVKTEVIDTPVSARNYQCGEEGMGGMEEGYQEVEVKEEPEEEEEEEEDRNHPSASSPFPGGVALPLLEEKEEIYCDNRCLLCHQPTMNRDKAENIAETNYKAMFILQKMLQVPNAMLADYLKAIGSPWQWVAVCDKCLTVVDQALKIEKEINRLEEKLKTCKRRMQLEIKSSWSSEEKQIPSRRKNTQFSRNSKVLMVTSEIRHLIYSRNHCQENSQNSDIPSYPSNDPLGESSPPTPPSCSVPDTDNKEEANDDLFDSCSNGDAVSYQDEEIVTATGGKTEKETDKMRLTYVDRRALTSCGYVCYSCPDAASMPFVSFMYHALFHFRRPLKCSECGIYFSSSSELKKNPLAKKSGVHQCSGDTLIQTPFNPGKIWECVICKETFSSDSERDSHENICQSSFTSEVISLQHSCSSCSKKFRSLPELILHRVLEHPHEASLACFFCGEIFSLQTVGGTEITDTYRLNQHINRDHKLFGSYKVPDDCDFCGSLFTQTTALHSHMEVAHGLTRNAAYSCPVCHNCRARRRGGLKRHLMDIHILGQLQRPPREPLICDICGHKNLSEIAALEHKLSKHGIEPEGNRRFHKCSKEGCTFRTLLKKSFSTHLMKEHAAERKYPCRICGKGFLSTSHRNGHEQIHLNATLKPFQCEICGNSFALRNYLYIHKRLSHENRPFASTHKKKAPRNRRRAPPPNPSEIQPPPPTNASNFTDLQGAPSVNEMANNTLE